jgi:GTPase SAR1 family protein
MLSAIPLLTIKIERKNANGVVKQKAPYHFSIQMTLVGPSGVGKTSLMRKALGLDTRNVATTLGTEDFCLQVPLRIPYADTIEQPLAHLQVCEISGDERYSSLWLPLIKGIPVLILMYDCQKEGSFECTVKKYYEELLLESKQWSHTMVVLFASKAEEQKGRNVVFAHKEAKKYAHERGWLFFKGSAERDTTEVLQEKFSRIATATLERWCDSTNPDSLWNRFVPAPYVAYKYISQ